MARQFYATSGRSDWPQLMRKVEYTHGTTLTKMAHPLPDPRGDKLDGEAWLWALMTAMTLMSMIGNYSGVAL